MKNTLEWHREGLANAESSLAYEERRLAETQRSVERMRERVAFRKAQITEAERRGMTDFDADRLLVKRVSR